MTDVQILSAGFGLSVLVLCLQQVFWMRNVQRLVDKSMSRSYSEYVQADNFRILPKNKTKQKEQVNIVDDYATKNAENANRAFGIL